MIAEQPNMFAQRAGVAPINSTFGARPPMRVNPLQASMPANPAMPQPVWGANPPMRTPMLPPATVTPTYGAQPPMAQGWIMADPGVQNFLRQRMGLGY